MTIHLEPYQFAMIVFAIIAGFWALFYALAKVIGKQLNAKFEEITKHLVVQDATMKDLEEKLTALRVEVGRDYVRRDDYIRDIGTLATKFEALAINLERMLHDMTKETIQMIRDATK